MINIITNIDTRILFYIQKHLHNQIFDTIMITLTNFGNAGILWIAISLALLFTKNHRTAGILTLCSLLVTLILGDGILKNIVERNRPFVTTNNFHLLVKAPSSYSFPSGHTSAAFAAASMLSYHLNKCKIVFFTLAVLMAFSRLYLYVHYPSDIVGGIILGLFAFFITLKIYNTLINKNIINSLPYK